MTTPQALIIAAGAGSRLRKNGKDIPKPLQVVAGLPLIVRIILTAKKAGITEFVIVVGYEKEQIMAALDARKLGVTITFVENPQWEKPNGLSVLAAKPHLRFPFVLLMSDHVFEAPTLEKFRKQHLKDNGVLLAVDSKLHTIFDMDDATKVKADAGKILSIGKNLQDYNVIDTGMFLIGEEFFTALEEAQARGKFSLSEGMQTLSERGRAGTYDIGEAFWQDVDTPATLQYAEDRLLKACIKPTDGFVSKNFNRKISLAITRQLLKTPLTANQVTFLTSIVGVLSGVAVAQGGYAWGVVGAILFKLTSILDGCDGEMSKLKFTASKTGQWLDTISDNLTYECFVIGLAWGLWPGATLLLKFGCVMAIFGLTAALTVMFTYLIRHTDSGTLIAIQDDFHQENKTGIKKWLASFQFLLKRDFFALFFLFLAIAGKLNWIIWLVAFATNVAWIVLVMKWEKLTAGRKK